MSMCWHLRCGQRCRADRTRYRMRMTPGTARREIVTMRMAPGAVRVARNSMRMRLGTAGTACGVFVPGAGNHLVPQIWDSKPICLDPITQNPVSERGRRIQRDGVTPAITTERAGKRHNHPRESPPGLRTVSTKQSIHTNSFLQKVPKKISERKQEKPPHRCGGFVHNIALENNSSSSFYIACFRGCGSPTPYVRPIVSGVNITHHLPKYVSSIPYASISKWSQMAKPPVRKPNLPQVGFSP